MTYIDDNKSHRYPRDPLDIVISQIIQITQRPVNPPAAQSLQAAPHVFSLNNMVIYNGPHETPDYP